MHKLPLTSKIIFQLNQKTLWKKKIAQPRALVKAPGMLVLLCTLTTTFID